MEIFSLCVLFIFYIIASTFVILKLIHMIHQLANIEESSIQEFFIPNKTKKQTHPETELNPNIDDTFNDGTLPLEQFRPNPKRPVTVKYDNDDEGNTLTEVEDGE